MSIFRGNGGSGSSTATSVIIPVSQGGTGATTIAEARLNINAAKNGVNSDITQLLGLEQPLSVAQGGTGARDASVARTNLGAASSAQGALADTALQEADVATVALTGSYNDLLDIPTAGTGDVVGPASSTDGAVALFDGTTGLLLKDGVVLGTAATTDSTDYATTAQGALADSALQSSDIGVSVQAYNANTVVDASYVHTDNNYTTTEKNKLAGIEAGAEVNVNADWNAVSGDAQILNKPTLGTAAATSSTDYATAAQGTKADTAYGWGNHASAGYVTDTSLATTLDAYVLADAALAYYAADSTVVHKSGDETISGTKTFSGTVSAGTYTGGNTSNWNTAYSWGNHASAGYLTALPSDGSFSTLKVGSASILGNSNADVTLGIAVRNSGASMGYHQTYNSNAGSDLKTWRWGGNASGEWVLEKVNDAYTSATQSLKVDTSGNVTATSFIGDGSSLTGVSGGQYFGNATTKAIAYNSQTISENITVTSGNSGLSAGPITISSGYTVTVASGSRWVIV